MLNLLTKTKPWMVASLIVASSVFGQNNCGKTCPPKPCAPPCPQPCPPTQVCNTDPCCPAWPVPVLNAAYNYPARIQTRCPWDIFADVSFIYWQPIEENLEIGIANTPAPTAGALTAGANAYIDSNVINMDFDYKPGFKVGLGGNFDYDNWDLRLEYTWFHNTNSQSSNGPLGGSIIPTIGTPDVTNTNLYDSVSGNWQLKMDIIDLDLGRWHYVGTKLVCHPTFGMRVDWIRQNTGTTYTRAAGRNGDTADVSTITQKSNSWAIGPKVGMDTNFDLGMGFRFFGNGEADLLFTKYTRLSYKELHTDATLALNPVRVKQNKVYAVKPHLDLELGFGWGTHLDCNNWYMDFALGYEFQVFFDQNMFRHFNDSAMVGNSTLPNGNLYVQGLTATFKLDF